MVSALAAQMSVFHFGEGMEVQVHVLNRVGGGMKPFDRMTREEMLRHLRWLESMLTHMSSSFDGISKRPEIRHGDNDYARGCASAYADSLKMLTEGEEGIFT